MHSILHQGNYANDAFTTSNAKHIPQFRVHTTVEIPLARNFPPTIIICNFFLFQFRFWRVTCRSHANLAHTLSDRTKQKKYLDKNRCSFHRNKLLLLRIYRATEETCFAYLFWTLLLQLHTDTYSHTHTHSFTNGEREAETCALDSRQLLSPINIRNIFYTAYCLRTFVPFIHATAFAERNGNLRASCLLLCRRKTIDKLCTSSDGGFACSVLTWKKTQWDRAHTHKLLAASVSMRFLVEYSLSAFGEKRNGNVLFRITLFVCTSFCTYLSILFHNKCAMENSPKPITSRTRSYDTTELQFVRTFCIVYQKRTNKLFLPLIYGELRSWKSSDELRRRRRNEIILNSLYFIWTELLLAFAESQTICFTWSNVSQIDESAQRWGRNETRVCRRWALSLAYNEMQFITFSLWKRMEHATILIFMENFPTTKYVHRKTRNKI